MKCVFFATAHNLVYIILIGIQGQILKVKHTERDTMHFKLDAHIHTSETSICAYSSGAEVAQCYHNLGYDAIVITDHLNNGFINRQKDSTHWASCVHSFLKGYRAAKAAGDKLGLTVIMGAELRLQHSFSDFLIYGIDEDFLLKNPFLHRRTIEDFYAKFSDQILIIQAHPFRDGHTDVKPNFIHGIEITNGNPDHTNNNNLAQALFEKHPHMYTTKGSDTHNIAHAGYTHMLFKQPIPHAKALRQAILERAYSQ